MDSNDKSFIAMLITGIFGLLILVGILFSFLNMDRKLRLEQPKYFIEFKGDVYELEKVK